MQRPTYNQRQVSSGTGGRFAPEYAYYYLFGPRGTGKSFWLASSYPDAYCIDLLQPDVRLEAVINMI